MIVDDALTLTVSIVAYEPDHGELRATLTALGRALASFEPSAVAVTVVDNSARDTISGLVAQTLPGARLVGGHGNVGYGRGHNMALERMGKFHLVLNPDVRMQPDALVNALAFFDAHPRCGLLSPRAFWPDGGRQYLCKRFPTLLDLLLRGFAPRRLRAAFDGRLARYEMRAETQDDICWNPPIVSGCFMLFRGETLRALRGFDPRYFLYFEDFDLSVRARSLAASAYVPGVEIVHAGGGAARKGLWHIGQFARSAVRFFNTYGIRLA